MTNMSPKGIMPNNLAIVQRLLYTWYQIWYPLLREKCYFKTVSKHTVSSAPYVGHVNPSSLDALDKLLQVTSYHYELDW